MEELLVGLRRGRPQVRLYTTAYWYYRVCRAAVIGAAGHLSGPFEALSVADQEQGVLSLLQLREDISLPDPRPTAPAMAELARRHPRLNLANLEAAAAGQLLDAHVWLSLESAAGVLPSVLDKEQVVWQSVALN